MCRTEEYKIKVKHKTLKGKWAVVEVSTLKCKDFYNTIHFCKIVTFIKIKNI